MTSTEVEADCCAPQGCCSGCCCEKCCCSMPHGTKVLFPLVTITVASTLSMIVLCNCRFLESGNRDPSSYPSYYVGLWGGCVYFPYDSSTGTSIGFSVHQEDRARKVAMSFGLLACIVGVTAMVGLWPITCKPYSAVWIHIIGGTVVFAFVSQLVTFSMFGTEYCNIYDCRLGWGGIMSLVAAILWLAGAIGVWMIPKKPLESTTRTSEAVSGTTVATETVKITETVQADGTKVTEKVTTAPDGTKTIEKTIGRSVAHADSIGGRGGVEKPQDVEGGSKEAVHAVAVP